MEKEVIFRDDLELIFGKRPWDEGKDHLELNRDYKPEIENPNDTKTLA